ncbi:hypothetical protein Tco_0771381 [Tanacetum coccineum]|uniref:Retrotransposon protein, putative, Ty1-copia subclass n=1 Tax=Tanacetum coccineum TaxID=301880 RepID=A0ABQ4ZFT7_9ASTR
MKDLGEAAYILGIKIYRDRSRRLISLCQSAYIEKILKTFYIENSKRGSIPMQEKLKLSKTKGASTPGEVKRMQNIPYALAMGSIMYVVRCTRPDVVFAQNITSRFQQNPELRVSCYTDAGYLTDVDDLKSQTGYVFILNGGAIDWKSIKQSIFATSSAEAEYIAASDTSKEAVWVRKFIYRLSLIPTIEEPIKMYCDNTRAITTANESGITKGAKHYRAKVHYLCEVIEFGDIEIEKFHTDDNLVDPFTNALPFPKHSEHTKNIGMLSASCDLDNSTSNVLIPLDSWTSGLLVYKLPLSVEYGVSTSIGYDVSSFLSNTAYSSQQINTTYPLPLDTEYRLSGTEAEILKELQDVMADTILSDNLEKAPTESNLSITSNDINIELSKEFFVELRKNIYHGTYNEDVVDQIVKVLKMVDLIYVPGVDSHQLRMKVFPLSLADDAKEWWISEEITTWEELVEKFFCRFYPESYDREDEINELKESKYEKQSNTATDSFFKAYEVRDIEKQCQTKRKYSNASNSIKELPNKRRCKAEKFKAIQYSLGPNEKYIAIRSYEYDIWERSEDNISKIYQDIFHKKDEG